MKLLLDKIMLSLQKRAKVTQSQKSFATWAAKGYRNEPEVSIVIQSHNKSLQVLHILPKLRLFPDVEIIVADDGSDEAHTRRLVRALNGANEFVVRCNDLYENIVYDRAIRFANGKYIALLQDDDDFGDVAWIHRAVSLFRSYPRMAILGGYNGIGLVADAQAHIVRGTPLHIAEGTGFCRVPAVNRAPMWIHKPLFTEYLRHIDFRFAPFQYDDYELCARAWLCGLEVGWYNAGFKSLSVGGMRLWNKKFTKEQCEKNGRLLYDLYAARIEDIHRKVSLANKQLP